MRRGFLGFPDSCRVRDVRCTKDLRRVLGGEMTRAMTLAVVAVWALGCSTTKTAPIQAGTGGTCATLGPTVCAALVSAGPDSNHLRYIPPNVQWTQYNQIMVDPVTFWAGDDSSVPPATPQALTTYFAQTLRQQLATKFQVVDAPGPGVMRLQVAITDVSAATPVLRTVSLVVPQAHALATLGNLATGSFAFAGALQAEGKLTDSITGRLLGAAIARRAGGGSVEAAVQWQWGDAENAMTSMATRLTKVLASLTSGQAVPPS